ncbi:MAG: peptidoglycan bridge formation glycyltransferase FemA/FemB family protein, partial [Saprospiraceae bacterium]|nr:peptidoglycan bridge formation glycyltransferase FemA/FemB family protein [Saprospiraceae bacterium]
MNGIQWNQAIARLPNAHLLQTWEWGTLKQVYGWQPLPQLFCDDAGIVLGAAMILQRRAAPLPLKILYVSRGPLVDWSDLKARRITLNGLESFARKQHAVFIKIDPEVILGTGVPGSDEAVEVPLGNELQTELQSRGWRYSSEQIQFRNTMILDLTEPEETWLARLKQKARYNLRLGEKRGVSVRVGSAADFPLLYRMYAETSVRDHFLIRSQDYYFTLWKTFLQIDGLEPLIAEVDGEAVGGIMVFYFAGKAWYMQ